MSETLLAVRDVKKSFGSLVAVDGVSFDVERGEIYGIAGPNGAGKSTLFNLITGIPFGPDSGVIEFAGRRIDRMPPHAICKLGVARTFQTEAVFDTLSVEENVKVAAMFGHAHAVADEAAAIQTALAAVSLDGQQARVAAELSVFEKKRLMLASALATAPEILLLDEPASGLTRPEQVQMGELVQRINASGVTVVLIEHVLPLLLSVSRRVMIMNLGRLLLEAPPSQIASDERVIESYLGERGKRVVHAVIG